MKREINNSAETDVVNRFRRRREERIKRRLDDDWITINGTHVMVDDDKKIVKGPERLRNGGGRSAFEQSQEMQKGLKAAKAQVTRLEKQFLKARGAARYFDMEAWKGTRGNEAAEKEQKRLWDKAASVREKYIDAKDKLDKLSKEYDSFVKKYRGEDDDAPMF